MMVDTHAHLSVCVPEDAVLVSAARQAGVERILTIGMDEESNAAAVAAAERLPEVFASVGRHPNAAEGFDDAAAAAILRLAAHPRVRAIGETGLDFYRDRAPRSDQRRAFEAQIEIARESSRPVVIHTRDAEGSEEALDGVFETLERRGGGVEVILHCFSAPQRVEAAVERSWYCSFAGNITFPKATGLRQAAAAIPDDLLLAETDSPFLAPQPVRGQPNQPANVVMTARLLAELRGVEFAELEQTVEANARRLFGW